MKRNYFPLFISLIVTAISLPAQQIIQDGKTIYLANTLVVKVRNSSALAPLNQTLAKFFVAGHEPVYLPGGTRDALRLEQASEITMTGDMVIDILNLDIYITAELATVYHLIPDTGIVHQHVTGHLEMKVSASGEKITIDINQYEITLVICFLPTYSYTSSSTLEKHIRQTPTFDSPCQEKLWKVSQAITRILIQNLSL